MADEYEKVEAKVREDVAKGERKLFREEAEATQRERLARAYNDDLRFRDRVAMTKERATERMSSAYNSTRNVASATKRVLTTPITKENSKQAFKATGRTALKVGGTAAVAGAVGGSMLAKGAWNKVKSASWHGDKENDDTSFWFLLIGLILYLSDIFITHFNGIDSTRISNYLLHHLAYFAQYYIFDTVTILILAFYFFLGKPSWRELLAFFLLESTVVIVIFLGWSPGTLLRLILLPYIMYKYISMSEDKTAPMLTMWVFLVIDFFVLEPLNGMVNFGNFHIRLIPFWFLFMMFITANMNRDWKSKGLLLIVFIFFILAFLSNVGGWNTMSAYLDPSIENDFTMMVKNFWSNTLGVYGQIVGAGQQMINQSSQIYREEYYTGEVDKNAERELGVYIEDIEKGQEEFYIDEPINLWTTLVVSTLDDKNITVKTSCIADKKSDNMVFADILRPNNFTAYNYDEKSIDCIFERNTFRSQESHRFYITADFDFTTMAYQKIYFMDRGKVLALSQQDIDPLEHYGIDDTDPKTIYTSGPVMIGMSFTSNPVKVDTLTGDDMYLTLGITLSNEWDGEIQGVDQLIITMPEGIEPNVQGSYECSGYNFTCTSGDGVICELQDKLPKFKEYKTIRCPVKITDSNKLMVLKEAPLSILYFRLTTHYNYTIEESTSVTIKESVEMKKLKEDTRRNRPTIDVPNLCFKVNDTIEDDLYNYSEDKETKQKNFFKYEITKQEDKLIAECKIVNSHMLSCKGYSNGTTSVEITVNDLAVNSEPPDKFDVRIVNDIQECASVFVKNIDCPANSKTDAPVYKCFDGSYHYDVNCLDDPVDESCLAEAGDSLGPIKKDKYDELNKIDLIGSSENVHMIKLIVDGDGKTEIGDLRFIMPNDDIVSAVKDTKSSYNTYIFAPKEESTISKDHEYTFVVEDKDGNQNSFSLLLNVIGDDCAYDCTKCSDEWSCKMSKKTCVFQDNSCKVII